MKNPSARGAAGPLSPPARATSSSGSRSPPSHRLSLQYHNHRDEIWVITEGRGQVEVADTRKPVAPGDMIVIPKLARHRLLNDGSVPLVFIETQVGNILDEEDIVRLEDDYNR